MDCRLLRDLVCLIFVHADTIEAALYDESIQFVTNSQVDTKEKAVIELDVIEDSILEAHSFQETVAERALLQR